MGIEIERKFLVKSSDFKKKAEPIRIIQGYLHSDTDKSIRIRIKGSKAFITIKSKVVDLSRSEFEYEIPVEDAFTMLTMCYRKIVKDRYDVVYGKHTWEIDEFHEDNEGLTMAEIELSSPDENFLKPACIGEEVSNDPRYFNSYLAEKPYKFW
ncbi:CYTH domain-containing protein [Methanococcoides sp. SA1]|nr:CYTH domain-containing protein [Methanococcoides sp. SA1]